MEIKTKYNIGDKVWLMHNNKCVLKRIENISIDVSNMYIQYLFDGNDIWLSEKYLFPNKEELLKSL